MKVACLIIAAILAVALGACSQPPPTLEVIRAGGELRVATLISATTYYDGAHGPLGFEYDFARSFAKSLGLEARFVFARDYRELRALLHDNKAHIAAALLPIGTAVDPGLRYGPSYAVTRQAVIHHRDRTGFETKDDLQGHPGAALDGRGVATLLERELPREAGYSWVLHDDAVADDLLQAVHDGTLDFAVLPSLDFDTARVYYPELETAFTIGQPQPVAWLFRRGRDDSLWQAQLEFLRQARETGVFDALFENYFGRNGDFDYVESRALLRHYDERLPAYRDDFVTMGERTNVDWRLLAAMAYQESLWRADARSPTGVRGLMMLTRRTAELFEVDRLDASDSIEGGARYFAEMKEKLPARIDEPDRTWLALAAYNIGPAHLEDARVLTDRAGDDPDRWADVRSHLPKLANKRWARKTRFGYARGHQAVHFVENTRRYYDVLRWLETEAAVPTAPSTATPSSKLVSPVL
ncbi:MAG: membrane-bound lytic murein transglycosylase MltF [Gammaproteobacteria bacterium]